MPKEIKTIIKINNVELMILAYAKTDTQWWHNFVENCPTCEVHFIKGRIKFLDAKGYQTKLPAPYPSVWIIYRRKEEIIVPVQSMNRVFELRHRV